MNPNNLILLFLSKFKTAEAYFLFLQKMTPDHLLNYREVQKCLSASHLKRRAIISQRSILSRFKRPQPYSHTLSIGVTNLGCKLTPWTTPHPSIVLTLCYHACWIKGTFGNARVISQIGANHRVGFTGTRTICQPMCM
uniref:Uncharacterized protein n=1 Tax=Helianthus annuus TaxID=4232 RepID=A0A251TTI0_HELAN